MMLVMLLCWEVLSVDSSKELLQPAVAITYAAFVVCSVCALVFL
jgi:hypothetical protein